MFINFSFISLYIIKLLYLQLIHLQLLQLIPFSELNNLTFNSSYFSFKINSIKCVNGYNINPVKIDISKLSFKNPQAVISYLSSLDEYTIISIGDKYKDLEDEMNNSGMKTYFANLDYINDLECKQSTCNYIRYKYKNVETGEDLWFFHKGFFIGSRNEIYNFIKRRNIKNTSNKSNEVYSEILDKIYDNYVDDYII